ncbi:MAG: hypothetical protein IPM16_19360 [Chloroflexi bacterium]|nr:hypothetical protein [Chloroflexota bacterium]
MSRTLAPMTRAVLALCLVCVLGFASAQDRLTVPQSPDTQTDPIPTVQPIVPPDNGLGRFDPNSALPPAAPRAVDGLGRYAFDTGKVDPALAAAITPALMGDTVAAEAAARNAFLPQDGKGRFEVVVWGGEIGGARVANKVLEAGGVVQAIDGAGVYAKLTAVQIVMLAAQDKIDLIQPQAVGRVEEQAQSIVRSPTGVIVAESYDVANAQAWHDAGLTGTGIDIAVIDFGFGTSTSASTELTCLKNYPAVQLTLGTIGPNDIRRGLDLAQILCDIVPGARVRLYKVTTATDLYNAITQADNNNDLIVIGAEFGVNTSPGDGTFGRASGSDVYQALANARQAGIPVVVAAGNTNVAYRTLTYAGGGATITIKAKPGDQVNISWNDWPDDPHPSGGAQDDLAVNLNTAGGGTQNKPARAGGVTPTHQFIVPSNCSLTGDFCSSVTLNITGFASGNATSVTVQVNVAGGLDREITGVSGATVLNGHGTLSRPADSPDVITVGAVCVDFINQFPGMDYSARGPVYDAGGNFSAPPAGTLTAFQVKPDVVGPTHVSVSGNEIFAMEACDAGVGGTQASAAYVAGMATLLLNNSALVNGFSGNAAPQNLMHYLRTHSIDLPLAFNAGGYDLTYGAGLPSLGLPTYDYDKSLNPDSFAPANNLPPGACVNGTVYVGPRNAGAPVMDGTLDFPYQSVMFAANLMAVSPGAGRCVIVLPGEYVSPWYFDNLNNGVSIFGYSGVSLATTQPSNVVVHNKYWGLPAVYWPAAGIFAQEGANTTVGGFTFQAGTAFNDSVFGQPQILAVDSVDNFTLTRSTVANFDSNRTLIEFFADADGGAVTENVFVDNRGRAGAGLIAFFNSGTSGNRMTISDNSFEDNRVTEGGWNIEVPEPEPNNLVTLTWAGMIRAVDGFTDVVNNVFRSNEVESLIQSVTVDKVSSEELRILGNVIVNTTVRTDDLGFTSGPMIHGFHQPRIMVINNTIALTNFQQQPPFNSLMGRGDDTPLNGVATYSGSLQPYNPITGEGALWDIYNNLLLDNNADQIVREFDGQFGSGGGCWSFSLVEDEGFKHNWYWDSGSVGNCGTSANNPAFNNIGNLDPYPDVGDKYLIGGADPTVPGFYALNNLVGGIDGVDDGLDAYVVVNLPTFAAGRDARGVSRRVDGDTDPSVLIDIGGYEYTAFFLQDPIDLTVSEDSGVIEFDIIDPAYIEGGFPPYTAEVLDLPGYFGTHCDSRFGSESVQGLAVESINLNTMTVAYCPPRDFHTDTTNPSFDPGGMSVELRITDGNGGTATTTITYTINPADDAIIATVLGDGSPAGDTNTVPVAIQEGPAFNKVRLRPYVDFSDNFVFSERGNTVEPTAEIEVDYDYEYPALPVLVADPGNNNEAALVSALAWSSQAQGILELDLIGLATPAQGKFSYEVKDRYGFSVTNFVTIKAVVAPSPFSQISPIDDAAITSLDGLVFTWGVSANATTYDLTIEKLVNNIYVDALVLSGLTPASDADGLTCAADCIFQPTGGQKALIGGGTLRWTVRADNEGLKRTASNAPLDFTVVIGKELLSNGDFELAGTTSKLAADWSLKEGTKDQRKCGIGIGNSCAFRFTGNSTSASIKQKPDPFGRTGDIVTFSAFVARDNLGSGGGTMKAKAKYINGDKDKLTLSINPGGSGAFPDDPIAGTIVLRYPVTKYVVKIQIKATSGKFIVDNASLSLDERISFRHMSPTDDDTEVADPSYITTLTWEPAALATSYEVELTELGGPTTVIDNAFTAIADGDDLTCGFGLCVLQLPGPLGDGNYSWTVTASTAEQGFNAPTNFTVDDLNGDELVVNGTFEDNNGASIPKDWTTGGLKTSASTCASDGQNPQYQGACAFKFVGESGLSAQLKQKLPTDDLNPGDTLTLRAVAQPGLALAQAQIKLQVKYNNGTKDTRTINIPTGSTEWITYDEDPITLNNGIKSVQVKLTYKGGDGDVLIDNVSVIRR